MTRAGWALAAGVAGAIAGAVQGTVRPPAPGCTSILVPVYAVVGFVGGAVIGAFL